MNRDISDEFNNVQASLSAEKLRQTASDEELKAAFGAQKQKLEQLFAARISKMSEEDQALYKERVKDRMAEVESMMSDSSKTFEEKKAQLVAWGMDVQDVLTDLEGEAQISESELQAVHANMTLTEAAVQREVNAAHEKISAEELLGHQTEKEQDAALADRAAEIRKAIERSGVELSGDLSGEVNAILGDSNAEIAAILQNESASDAEKKKLIEAIDHRTKNEVAKLSSTQVASEHALESFEESEGDFDGDVQSQMAQLENVLKDGQMSYVKHMIQEKNMLQDQANQMVGLVENLLKVMNNQEESSGAELSKEETEQKAELTKFLLAVKAQSEEKKTRADDALQIAKQAKRSLEASESMTTSDLLSIEDRINTAVESSAKTTNNMRQRLADERENRRTRQAVEKNYALRSSATVTEQLEYISWVLNKASEKAKEKTEELEQKVNYTVNMIKAHGIVAGSSGGALGKLKDKVIGLADQKQSLAELKDVLNRTTDAVRRLQAAGAWETDLEQRQA